MTHLKPQINPRNMHVGCLNCSSAAMTFDLDRELDAGFGWISLYRDGECILYGECISSGKSIPHPYPENDGGWLCWEDDFVWTGHNLEAFVAPDPAHDWRLWIDTPMHGEIFQRHSAGKWRLIESTQGFA